MMEAVREKGFASPKLRTINQPNGPTYTTQDCWMNDPLVFGQLKFQCSTLIRCVKNLENSVVILDDEYEQCEKVRAELAKFKNAAHNSAEDKEFLARKTCLCDIVYAGLGFNIECMYGGMTEATHKDRCPDAKNHFKAPCQ